MQTGSLDIEMAFFRGDVLLCRGTARCISGETNHTFDGADHSFQVTHAFELPACRVFITASTGGKHLFRSASRMGVHTSDDWEAIDLGAGYSLVFKCTEVPQSTG